MQVGLKKYARDPDLFDRDPRTHRLPLMVLMPATSAGKSKQQLSTKAARSMRALRMLHHRVCGAPRLRALSAR